MKGARHFGSSVRNGHFTLARVATPAARFGLCLVAASACYHAVPVVATTSPPDGARADSTSGGAGAAARLKQPPRCAAFFLLVENALPRPVEIYEVGQMSDRFVAYAQIGFTELPMTESSQQFIAMSRGELMAASSAHEHRPGDRVALQRSCRPV